MKCLIIYTPFSKKGKFEKFKNFIYKKISEKYSEVIFYKTKYHKHAIKIAKENAGLFNLIIIAGGDGLISQVVNGVLQTPFRPLLAILPVGTANDTASTLKIPKNIKKALKIISYYKPQNCDVVSINNHYSVYEISIGQGTKCSYSAKNSTKMKFGWFAYLLQVFNDIFKNHYNYAEFSFNDGKINFNCHYSMFVLLNANHIAKLNVNKFGKINDQKICFVLFKRKNLKFLSWLNCTFNLIKFLLFGISAIKHNKNCVVIEEVYNYKIINHSQSNINVDGEFFSDSKEIVGQVISNQIKILNKK